MTTLMGPPSLILEVWGGGGGEAVGWVLSLELKPVDWVDRGRGTGLWTPASFVLI